jgi:nitrite reductase/ring-hydroxylating ferredoxin subunit
MAREFEVGAAAELVPGVVRGAGRYAVGNAAGELFAVTRRCRHLGVDLGNGSVDREGCLVCPWHGARYDVATGRMTQGPQGFSRRSRRGCWLPCDDECPAAWSGRAPRAGRHRVRSLAPSPKEGR